MEVNEQIAVGEYDSKVITLFVEHNLDMEDFVSGNFKVIKELYACLAVHLELNWKDKSILRALYDLLLYNKRSIRDTIGKTQSLVFVYVYILFGKLWHLSMFSLVYNHGQLQLECPLGWVQRVGLDLFCSANRGSFAQVAHLKIADLLC